MNIGFLTTWNSICGVSEWSRHLVTALQGKGHNITVFANHLWHVPLAEDEDFVHRVFHMSIKDNRIGADVDFIVKTIEEQKVDILVIQFESCMYHRMWFMEMLDRIKCPIVFEYHSSCIWAELLQYMYDKKIYGIVHTNQMPLPNSFYVPMGIPEIPYVAIPHVCGDEPRIVASYGLGRNDDRMVIEAVKMANERLSVPIVYKTAYHDGDMWKKFEDLIQFLQKADVLVLYYPPVDAVVSSSAVDLALAIERPIVTSETNWFNHCNHLVNHVKWNDVPMLAEAFRTMFENYESTTCIARNLSKEAKKERGMSKIVARHEELYSKLLKTFDKEEKDE